MKFTTYAAEVLHQSCDQTGRRYRREFRGQTLEDAIAQAAKFFERFPPDRLDVEVVQEGRDRRWWRNGREWRVIAEPILTPYPAPLQYEAASLISDIEKAGEITIKLTDRTLKAHEERQFLDGLMGQPLPD